MKFMCKKDIMKLKENDKIVANICDVDDADAIFSSFWGNDYKHAFVESVNPIHGCITHLISSEQIKTKEEKIKECIHEYSQLFNSSKCKHCNKDQF